MVGLAKGADMDVLYNSFSRHTQFDALLMDHVELRQKQFHTSIRRYYYVSTVGGSTIVVNNERV